MRHIEIAHLSRAVVDLQRDDGELFDRLCAQFMRKHEQLPLSVLFFFCVSMTKSRAVVKPPKNFFDIVVDKVKTQITELTPFEIAFSLDLVSRYNLHTASVTDLLFAALETNLYNFPPQHLAIAISALVVLQKKPSEFLGRTLPILDIAGPHQPHCLLATYALLRHRDGELPRRQELLRVLRNGPDAIKPTV